MALTQSEADALLLMPKKFEARVATISFPRIKRLVPNTRWKPSEFGSSSSSISIAGTGNAHG